MPRHVLRWCLSPARHRVRWPRIVEPLLTSVLFYGPPVSAEPGAVPAEPADSAPSTSSAGDRSASESSPLPGEPQPAVQVQVTPPVLRQYQAAQMPPGYRVPEATFVDLQLTIDATGAVQAVRALSPQQPELLDAVTLAARRFVFAPALRTLADGSTEPIAVVIQYRYWIEPSPPDSPRPLDAAKATAEGGPDVPRVPLARPAEQAAQTADAPVSTPPASSLASPDVYEGTAEVEAPAREPTKRTLKQHELSRVAGTRGDPLRAIEIMPGVAQSTGESPIIRGSAGQSSATFLDGSQVPFMYHFGGVTSFVHPGLVESVDLYPGNFSARYGRVTGGIVEAKLRSPKAQWGVLADANLIDSSLLVEGPVTDRLRVAAAARRSNIDLVFDSLVPDDTFDVVAAPVYYDYQGIVEYKSASESEFRLAAFGSRDALKLVLSKPADDDASLRGTLQGAIEFHRLQVRHKSRLGNLKQTLQASVGLQRLFQEFGPSAKGYFDIYEFDTRDEWEVPVSPSLTLIAGIDAVGQRLVGAYRGSAALTQEGSLADGPVEQVVIERTVIPLFNPALYLEARVAASSKLMVVPGVRVDYYHQLKQLTVNPRISQRFAVAPSTVFKSGFGLYSEPPLYYEALDIIGNPKLDAFHSLHTSVGVEQVLAAGWNVQVEGFYKTLYHRVVNTERGEAPHFINDGQGRIFGAELSSDYHGDNGLSAQLSYTLSRSARRDRNQPWRLFDSDQPHILNLAVAYAAGAGWELSGRFRYVSGNPVTQIDDAVYDASSDRYIPIWGALNAARDPAFNQLDLRVEKAFGIGAGELALYLDVQNVYAADNPQGYSYSYDYQTKEPAVSGFFFPNLGLRGRL